MKWLRPEQPAGAALDTRLATDAYLAVLDGLLRAPALAADRPAPRFDPNAPGPPQAIVRLAFCRSVPLYATP